MRLSKIWVIVVSIIIILVSIFIILDSFSQEQITEDENCIDVNQVAGFVYDVCYDSYTKNILMLVKRNPEDYMLDSFNVSFLDIKERKYSLKHNIINNSRLYKFYAETNPQIIYVTLNIVDILPKPNCNNPQELFIRYCLTKSPGWGKGSLNGSEIEDYILLEEQEGETYADFFNISEKETSWKSICTSDWKCSEWESCEENLQMRSCEDKNKCTIPTSTPETVRPCDLECVESWNCDWSDCIDGFTIPTCRDENECGSLYALPPKINCLIEIECRPFIQCNSWSSCEFDYNLVDLNKDDKNYKKGVKSRVCRDLNFCIEPKEQIENCSIGMDIYTQKFTKCGTEFIGIYNQLNNKLIARIDEGQKNESILNIHLDDSEDNFYCDYCFNGIKDEDEESLDCGGSCEECSNKYQETTFRKKNWWNNLSEWIIKIWNR